MIKATLYSISGNPKSEILLPEAIFGTKVNLSLISQAVRSFLSNQRSGNASTKTRALINRTKAKWFRQKGTGRARHGSRSAPIFVGGGIAHGPHSKSWYLDFPEKMKRAALASALTQKLKDKDLIIIETIKTILPKTKEATKILKNLKLEDQKLNWIIGTPHADLLKAVRNIKNVNLKSAHQLTTYEVLNCQKLLLQEDSIAAIANRFHVTFDPKPQKQKPKAIPKSPISSRAVKSRTKKKI